MHSANFVHDRSGHPELIDVLDRVLDKGIIVVFDINISVAGLRFVEITGNTVIASIDTYLRMTDDAVIQAQHSPALSHAADEFLRRVDHHSTTTT
jgi:hypothetical protein